MVNHYGRMGDLCRQRDKLQKDLSQLDLEIQKLEHLTDEQKIADAIHMQLCRHNHADACSYLYEPWDNPGIAKGRELKRTRRLLKFCGNDTDWIFQLLEALKD